VIEGASANWRLDRMARVDRNVLRLAVHELLHLPDVPVKVVINEAIELGKKYGSESSGAFVNGVLDGIAARLPPRPGGG
jgi:N utilization substance protein B